MDIKKIGEQIKFLTMIIFYILRIKLNKKKFSELENKL